ncbi:MAG TPA: hypothetical protein PK671_10285, partial [Candidatus Obscuribacter sp.]|nr:hypothetical protein [Candidatus Obscuribacter sp.]
MDAAKESISWETYLTAGVKAYDLSRLEDAEKLFQKALIEARRELARLRGDEMDGVVVAVSEELESSSPQVASGKKHSGGLAQASAEDDEQSAKPGLARRGKAPSDNSPEQMRGEDGL